MIVQGEGNGPGSGDVPGRFLALLADIAQRLLAADNPLAMVDELFVLIQTELRLDVFFNYRLEGDALRLVAYGGLTPAEAAAGASLALGEAVCGCVARDRVPHHATAIQRSSDPHLAFVRAIGLDSYACTPLQYGGELLGTLGFGRRGVDRFTADELSFLHTLCHYVALAKQRFRTEERLREGLKQRERLLSELNHRVRNALQIGIGLISSQALTASDPAVRAALHVAADRMQVVAAAHRPLYRDMNPDGIELAPLLAAVAELFGDTAPAVSGAAPFPLPVERAVALGLLVHAMLSESMAAGDTPVQIELGKDAAGNLSLRLRIDRRDAGGEDDAVPSDRMTAALARQLRAQIARVPEGLCLTLPAPSTGPARD